MMKGMSTPDGDRRQENEEDAAGEGQIQPRSTGDVSPYSPNLPVPPKPSRVPAVPPARLPYVLETRPVPALPGGFVAFWSQPLVIIGILVLILVLVVMLVWALLRGGPDTIPVTAGPTSASPTGTATASVPAAPSLEPETPEAPPSNPGGVAPTRSGPAVRTADAAGLPPFDPSDVDPYSSGVISLGIDDYLQLELQHWQENTRSFADISFTEAGIAGQGTVQLALVSAGESRSFPTCRDKTSWVPSLTWGQVARGSFICIRWLSRRGMMRIDEMPDMDESRPSVTVNGTIWRPEVK
jgi:hypothetical protein